MGRQRAPFPPLVLAGLYLATAGADQALVVWDVNERTCIEKRLLPGCATGLAWHPTKNALAVITEDGGWQPACPVAAAAGADHAARCSAVPACMLVCILL